MISVLDGQSCKYKYVLVGHHCKYKLLILEFRNGDAAKIEPSRTENAAFIPDDAKKPRQKIQVSFYC